MILTVWFIRCLSIGKMISFIHIYTSSFYSMILCSTQITAIIWSSIGNNLNCTTNPNHTTGPSCFILPSVIIDLTPFFILHSARLFASSLGIEEWVGQAKRLDIFECYWVPRKELLKPTQHNTMHNNKNCNQKCNEKWLDIDWNSLWTTYQNFWPFPYCTTHSSVPSCF